MLIELEYPTPEAVTLPAADTLLLVVDMQNAEGHPKGPMYSGEQIEQVTRNIAALRDKVRAAGGKIVYTQSVRKLDSLELSLFKNRVRKLEGSWDVEFVDALKPAPGEPIIVKYTHDCFHKTGMEALLERLNFKPGKGRVIVTGVAARVCVQQAVTAFSIRDYYVYVPMDCTTQSDEKEILQAYSLFTGFGYRFNVKMTRSDLVSLD
jgi:nicotinamidase-related amidase